MTKRQRRQARRPGLQRETWRTAAYDPQRRQADPAKKKARKQRQRSRRRNRS